MHAHIRLLETWFDKVWRQKNADAIDEMFLTTGQVTGLGDRPVVGPGGVREFHAAMLKLVDQVHFTIDHWMVDEDRVFASCTLNATAKATGKAVSMRGCCFGTIRDGKLASGENHWDFMSFFEQLGQLPKNSFARALAGHILAPS